MARKRMKMAGNQETVQEVFSKFVLSKTAQGVSEKTVQTYRSHFHCIGKYIDLSQTFQQLTKDSINGLIVSMRNAGLSPNSVSSYMRVFRTFLGWCKEEGYTDLTVPNIKDREVLKDTYTDEELSLLLAKPPKNCDFSEYRNWVIVNLLLNCGCRAATIRNIHTSDVDLPRKQIMFRHTKTGKIQSIPLCSSMVAILGEYLSIRGGSPEDFLFPNDFGEMMEETGLRTAIYRYNKRRGVHKTSLHLFRHTFARKFLVDCRGDAFTLQRILGHSTLEMTKHYCSIYDADIATNFDEFSPLSQLNQHKQKISRRV